MDYTDRDLNWLSFNERILQEAENEKTPLMERIKFIAIYSSNLEEFYRVRVASHHFEQKFKGDERNKYGYRPSYLLQKITKIVSAQQERLGKVFYSEIIPGLSQKGINLLTNKFTGQDQKQMEFHYQKFLQGNFILMDISEEQQLQLKNQTVYLFAISAAKQYLIELDYKTFGRFIDISTSENEIRIVQLDDIFRYNADKIFGGPTDIFAIKISRDAELYMDEEQDGDLILKIKKSIKNRETGLPSRLLFDENIPFKYIDKLRKKINVEMSGLIPGGHYHNFYDFFSFPVSDPSLHYPKREKVPCSRLDLTTDWFKEIKKENIFLSFPYQSYNYVTRFLTMAAEDEDVEEINITLYRVATKNSEICLALESAARKGKKVFVLDEAQARFDEQSNIYWGERLKKAGVLVKYGINNLKVHAKIFSVKRKEGDHINTYAYMSTGNFNEKTAEIYADHALLTCQANYIRDIDQLFLTLKNDDHQAEFESLLVAPFNLRSSLKQLIENEINLVKQGKKGKFTFKLNSLEDTEIIDTIRNAADNRVEVELIVRGICCYHPQTTQQEKNITVVSIVDRYLEHTRIYHFQNNGQPLIYLASADLMTRNLSKRIEVAFPINNERARSLLLSQLNGQLQDNVKGRQATGKKANHMLPGKESISSQEKMFQLVSNYNVQDAI